MPFFYDLTQETVYDSVEEEDAPDSLDNGVDPSALQTPKEKLHPEGASANETPATKPDDSPCAKANDRESFLGDEILPFRSLTPEEGNHPPEGIVKKETLASAAAPSRTGSVLGERHLPNSESSSVKLFLLRRDENEQGSDTRLILEKIWDLKSPVEIGRRVSQSVEITNGLFNDRLVSRKHAIVYAEGTKVVIHDIGSSHGTFVNGQRVMTVKELHDGDRLNLGQFSSGKAPYIVQIVRGTDPNDDTNAERPTGDASKKRDREMDAVTDTAYFIFDGLEDVENRIAKRIRVSSAISAIVGGVVGGLSVGCAIVGLANLG